MQRDFSKLFRDKIIPLASDSLGVRSFSLFVDTGRAKIIIDPGLDIAPVRFGLPPHRKEIERFYELKSRIETYLEKTDIVIVTHYHHDHFTPDLIPLFKGKRVILKDFNRNINYMQKRRSKEITGIVKDYEIADGNRFEIPGGEILFSPPLPHGRTPAVVVSVCIRTENFTLIHTSDISGPLEEKSMSFILEMEPDILFLDGPAIYLNPDDREPFLKNMEVLLSKIPGLKLIIDHHTTRDPGWRKKLPLIAEIGTTFAGFRGEEESPLEGLRRVLWETCED